MFLEADLVMTLGVEIGESMPIGNGADGYLNVIPITGGTFKCMDNNGVYVNGSYCLVVQIGIQEKVKLYLMFLQNTQFKQRMGYLFLLKMKAA